MNSEAHNEVKYVGFWIRFLATIIDSLLLYGIVFSIIYLVVSNGILDINTNTYLGFHLSLEWIVPAIIVILLWAKFGATPGKMLFKAKIVDANTLKPASTMKLTGRYFAYFISMMPLFLGIIWVAWDKKKQGFHDKIAQTLVIKN